MKYVALLRGINVGGNNIIKMSDLKDVLTKHGFTDVATYIQSGNVIFSSPKTRAQIISDLEKQLSNSFHYMAKIVLLSQEQLETVLHEVPSEWKGNNDLRCYIAFIKDHVSVNDVVKEVEPKEGVDTVTAGKQVVYLSTKLSGLTKSGFTKLIAKKIYKDITMRNYATTQKIRELMR